MRIVTKHLLREYLLHLFYCVVAFLMMFVLYDLIAHIAEIMSGDAPAYKVLAYYLSIVLESLYQLLPASLLLATLYTLWQLSRSNEITAMRASGISLYSIMGPFLAVGIIASVLTIGVNEFVTPRLAFWAEAFKKNDFKELKAMAFPNQAHYSSRKRRLWHISVLDLKQPNVVNGVKITNERDDGTRSSEINAHQGFYMDGQWWLVGTQIQKFDTDDGPIGGLVPPISDPDDIRQFDELSVDPVNFAAGVKEWEHLSSMDMYRFVQNNPNMSPRSRAYRHYDIHARLAGPWACFIVTLFAIPAGLRGSRRNALVGIFMAIGMFFAYYTFTQVGMFLGKREMIPPPLGAWLPNLLFLWAGVIMVWRAR
jgi:lipopolysaccharide export system permease protein